MNSKTRKIILSLVLISLVFNYVYVNVHQSSAAIGDHIIGGIACSAGGILGGLFTNWLAGQLGRALNRLTQWISGRVPNFGVGSVNDALSHLFLPADEVPTNDATAIKNYFNKENIMDIISRCVAREILNSMTNRMIGAVRTSGRDGGPAFVRNWRNFLAQANQRGEGIFRSMVNETTYCDYFDGNIKSTFRANGAPTLPSSTYTRINSTMDYRDRARCSMPQGWNANSYRNDFSGNGGWSAFSQLLLPQNNPVGSFLMATEEMGAQKAWEQMSDQTEANANGGFLSRLGYSQAENCKLRGLNGCLIPNDILTPGSTLRDTAAATIQQELAWVANVDEWNELISSLISTLMSRILNLSRPDTREQTPFPPEPYPGFDNGDPDTNYTDPGPGGGSGPYCGGTFLSDNYSTQVQGAVDWVNNNTTLDDGAINDQSQVDAYLNAVVNQLISTGLTAGRVYTQLTRTLINDSIMVGNATDTDGTVYQIVTILSGQTGRIGDFISIMCEDHASWNMMQPSNTVPPPPSGSIAYGVTIQASNGQYLSALDGTTNTGWSIYANLSAPASQTYALYDLNGGSFVSGDQVAIRTTRAYYFSANQSGGSTMSTSPIAVGPWETFTVNLITGTGSITDGAQVSFRANDGINYVVAENGGGDVVNANRTAVGPWETFTIFLVPVPTISLPQEPYPDTECDDGLDNDGDGFFDYPSDPQCTSYSDIYEST